MGGGTQPSRGESKRLRESGLFAPATPHERARACAAGALPPAHAQEACRGCRIGHRSSDARRFGSPTSHTPSRAEGSRHDMRDSVVSRRRRTKPADVGSGCTGVTVTPASCRRRQHATGVAVTPASCRRRQHATGVTVTPASCRRRQHATGVTVTPASCRRRQLVRGADTGGP